MARRGSRHLAKVPEMTASLYQRDEKKSNLLFVGVMSSFEIPDYESDFH